MDKIENKNKNEKINKYQTEKVRTKNYVHKKQIIIRKREQQLIIL